MPPKTAKSLFAMLRKQSQQARPYLKPDSAFGKLGRGGKKRTYTEFDEEEQEVPKSKKATIKKAIKPRTKEPTPEPVIESWPPVRGEAFYIDDDLFGTTATDALGLARVPTWRLLKFQGAAEELIKKHGGFEKVMTHKVVHGSESLTDVYFIFGGEAIAAEMKEKIEGEMVVGRKVRVTFADDDDLLSEGDWVVTSPRKRY